MKLVASVFRFLGLELVDSFFFLNSSFYYQSLLLFKVDIQLFSILAKHVIA